MRICLVYDCLYPYTIGGAERWYRNLAESLAAQGHQVTYLTMRQWDATEKADVPGVKVVEVAPQMELYEAGRRRILPPLAFGVGVLRHLLSRHHRYDVVHTASFPYFSLLAAALVRRRAGFRLTVDWHELWTPEYWREYLGRLGGRAGWEVQRLCLRVPQHAFCFSQLVEQRLRAEGVNGEVTRIAGQFEGDVAEAPLPSEPLVVFAGRHIPEKNPVAVVHAVATARETIPELRAAIYGDGPDRPRVLAAIAERGLEGIIEAPGFVKSDTIEDALARALCLLLPSRREGYGLVVLEALSKGTPAVVVRGKDNAAAEFIQDGENGFIAPDADPQNLARSITKAFEAGLALRRSTLQWFAANATPLALDTSLARVTATYAGPD